MCTCACTYMHVQCAKLSRTSDGRGAGGARQAALDDEPPPSLCAPLLQRHRRLDAGGDGRRPRLLGGARGFSGARWADSTMEAIRACMHAYAHMQALARSGIHMHAYMHTCMHTALHACMHTHAWLHTCMPAHMHAWPPQVRWSDNMEALASLAPACVVEVGSGSSLAPLLAEATSPAAQDLTIVSTLRHPKIDHAEGMADQLVYGEALYACMHACMYACMHACMYSSCTVRPWGASGKLEWIHAYMHTYIHACMHTYMHTHTRTHAGEALGSLWEAGVPVQWAAYHRGERYIKLALPTYAFEPDVHWVDDHASMYVRSTAEELAQAQAQVCMHMRACMHMYACTRACMHAYAYACVYACMHVHGRTCMHMHGRSSRAGAGAGEPARRRPPFLYMHAYIHAYMHTYMHTYIHTYWSLSVAYSLSYLLT